MKVSDLSGAELDFWVSEADKSPFSGCSLEEFKSGYRLAYQPSTDWKRGGQIIEREKIQLRPKTEKWTASMWNSGSQSQYVLDGPTPLIAAMRAFVASKFGEEVE